MTCHSYWKCVNAALVFAGGRGTPWERDGACIGHNDTTVMLKMMMMMMMMILVSSYCPSHVHSAQSVVVTSPACDSKANRSHLHLQQSISHVQFATTRKTRLYCIPLGVERSTIRTHDVLASRILVPLFWRQTTLERMAANLRFRKRRLDIL
jgi:hypothetical protein